MDNSGNDWPRLLKQALEDARYICGDGSDKEDLVQDALVLLLEREEEIEHPRAWLRGTIMRLCISRYRSRARTFPAPSSNFVYSPELLDLRLTLSAAQRELTGGERRLLHLLARGHSQQEIAGHLCIGWKSVGSRVQRLRAKLRRVLAASSTGGRHRLGDVRHQ